MMSLKITAVAVLASLVAFWRPVQTALLENQPTHTEQPTGNPEELGTVQWIRSLDEGTEQAKQTGKPLLILFQEVPGCSNCTRYGNVTLRHPLIVEAIETYFTPVCIYNNKGGKDGEALKKFDEPAWNNPVVRIVRPESMGDIIPRMPDFRSSWQIVNGMRRALDLQGIAAPTWLELLETELKSRETGLETATFSMYCFWSGEGTFGEMDGVIETEPGFQDGKEVVKVLFDPTVVKRSELEAQAQPKGIQACQKNEGFRADHEPKYYLSKTHWRYLPMISLQASRANSLVGQGQSPQPVLSPRQIALAKTIQANPQKHWKNAIGKAILDFSDLFD